MGVARNIRKAQKHLDAHSPGADAPRLVKRSPLETIPRHRRAWNDAFKYTIGLTALLGGVTFFGNNIADWIRPDGMCPDDPRGCEEVPIVSGTPAPPAAGQSGPKRPALADTTKPVDMAEGGRYQFSVCKSMVFIKADGTRIEDPIAGYDPDHPDVGLLPRPVTSTADGLHVDVARYQPGSGHWQEADGDVLKRVDPDVGFCAETFVTLRSFPIGHARQLAPVIEGQQAYPDQPVANQMPATIASRQLPPQ